MATVLIETIGALMSLLLDMIISLFGLASTIFYNNGSITFVGTLLLMGLALKFAKYPINFIVNLIRGRNVELSSGKDVSKGKYYTRTKMSDTDYNNWGFEDSKTYDNY